MKTRILHTRFWKDNFVSQLNRTEKLIFVYLLTNEHINITGIYELPDKFIKTDLEVTQVELDQAKRKLQEARKIIFDNGWVKVVNADKYNSYNGEKLEKAREREKAETPESLIHTPYPTDTSMDTSIYTPNNHNHNNINNINTNKGNSKDYMESITPEVISEIAIRYSVPESFVKSKLEDIELWEGEKPGRMKGRNWKLTLINWVKRDSLKIRQEYGKQNSEVSI